MEGLLPEGKLDIARPSTGSPNRSSSLAQKVLRQRGGEFTRSVLLLDGASSSESCFREPKTSARGGKRPRTTSSIFAAAATGMLMGGTKRMPEATVLSIGQGERAGHNEQPPDALFSLRKHVECERVAATSATTGGPTPPDRKRVPAGNVTAIVPVDTVARSKAAAPTVAGAASSAREDTFGEAEAMEADERRSSPMSFPAKRFAAFMRKPARGQPLSSPQSSTSDTPEGLSHAAAQRQGAAAAVAPGIRFSDSHDGGSSSPSAPAYEPSLFRKGGSTGGESWRCKPEIYQKESSGGSPMDRQQQQEQQQEQQGHESTAARLRGGYHQCVEVKGSSPRRSHVPTTDCEGFLKGGFQAEVENGGRPKTPQQLERCVPSLEGDRPSSPRVGREGFLSTMKRSNDAYNRVRRDLEQYMEKVRARTSEDGTPSVTFPRNFDRIVGLMGRNELEDRTPEQHAAKADRSGGTTRSSTGGNSKEQGRGKGESECERDRPPQWTQYLLEEGLDHTKAFSRYRGMFADEQTGEDRFMRGLAKMRELDLRLAQATEKARELKVRARDVSEQAEHAAAGAFTGRNEQTACNRRKGRGPMALEDVANDRPNLRLKLPSFSEPAPFGAISSRVSNGTARQVDDGGVKELRTERSETSTASGRQTGGDGGSRGSRDEQARGGRAFLTQKFRGAERQGPLPHSGSNPKGVNGSDMQANTAITTGSSRGNSKSTKCGDNGDEGDVTEDRGVGSARSSGGGCSRSGGGSGVSFVLKNKRHAAKASRRRLTDEQERLVTRFLEDVDGFNNEGEPTGEKPSGVWAEIGAYGGAGASDDAARLAKINAQLLAMGGLVLPDSEGEQVEDNPAQEREQGLSLLRKAAESGSTGQKYLRHKELEPPPPPPPQPSSRSRVTTGVRVGAIVRDGAEPGDAALREHRARRETRHRERAIDTALEQLRECLFEDSAAGGRNLREKAIDTALELVRTAPLDTQGGVRRGAGRLDSLLGGQGPQPVGDWEVKHALRQGEEELRGKELASRERIEELLVTARQNSAANSECATDQTRGKETIVSNEFSLGTTLDDRSLFANTTRGDDGTNSPSLCLLSVSPPTAALASASGRPWVMEHAKGPASDSRGRKNEGEKRGEWTATARAEGGTARLSGGSSMYRARDLKTERERSSPRKELAEVVPAATAKAAGPSPGLLPCPRPSRKRNPPASVSTELIALFRAPLLAPRRLDPPIAGIAAAAVAAGGKRSVKPWTKGTPFVE